MLYIIILFVNLFLNVLIYLELHNSLISIRTVMIICIVTNLVMINQIWYSSFSCYYLRPAKYNEGLHIKFSLVIIRHWLPNNRIFVELALGDHNQNKQNLAEVDLVVQQVSI